MSARVLGSGLLRAGGIAMFAATSYSLTMTPSLQCDEKHSSSRVFTWGSGQYGEVGHGDDKDLDLPTIVKDLDNLLISKIFCKGQMSAAVTDSGALYTFGRGRDCALGHGTSAKEAVPRMVDALSDQKIVDVGCGMHHMAAISDSGVLYTWGRCWTGQLGRATSDEGQLPAPVSIPGKVVLTSCGLDHTLVLTEDGKVFSMGSGDMRATGLGHSNDAETPELIKYFDDNKILIQSVSAGEGFSMFLSRDGNVYTCGSDDYGKLGHGKGPRYESTPKLVSALKKEKIVQICAGELFSAAVTEDGRVFTWGFGKDGQTGHQDTANIPLPKLVHALAGENVVDISCGGGHVAALTKDNKVFMWGRGRSGQLGRGNSLESIAAYRTSPVQVGFFDSVRVKSIACGSDHSMALIDN